MSVAAVDENQDNVHCAEYLLLEVIRGPAGVLGENIDTDQARGHNTLV